MSQIQEYLKIALMNIKSNKGRSILTMLGIIIGISSVILVISIGNGVRGEINSELDSLAGGQLYIYGDSNVTEPVTFQQEDFDSILDKVDHVKAVTPQYYLYGTAEGPKGNFSANGNAGNPGQQYTFSDPIVRGRYFNESEYYNASKVCIITKSSAILLFGTDDVLGMSFDLSLYGVTQELTIVGIRDDNQSRIISMMNGADSVQIEMPITTLGAYYNFYIEDFDSFYVVAEKAEYSKEVATKWISLLETRHNARGQ